MQIGMSKNHDATDTSMPLRPVNLAAMLNSKNLNGNHAIIDISQYTPIANTITPHTG